MRPWRLMADQYEGNATPDFDAYRRAGHLRYMHKATEGLTHVDRKHAARVSAAHFRDLYVVHYHFARPDQGVRPRAEAVAFWAQVRDLWRPGDRLVLDCEPPFNGPWEAPRWYIEELWTAVERRAPQAPAIYGSTSFLKEQVSVRWLRTRRRHEAAYGPVPSRWPWGTHWWAWQATDGTFGPEPHSLQGIGDGDISVLSMPLALADRIGYGDRRKAVKNRVRAC